MMKTNYKNWFWILAVLTTVLVFTLSYYGYQKIVEVRYQTQQIAALTDTVTLYKTKVATGAKRKIFIGNRNEVLQVLKPTDKKGYEMVNKTKDLHSYTQFSTSIKIDTTAKADLVAIKQDSAGKASIEVNKTIIEPNNHYQADIRVKDDSVSLKLAMTDKYHLISSEKSNGFIKPKSYIISVENENPYVTITDVKSFEIKPKNKVKTGIKVGVVSIGLATAAILILK